MGLQRTIHPKSPQRIRILTRVLLFALSCSILVGGVGLPAEDYSVDARTVGISPSTVGQGFERSLRSDITANLVAFEWTGAADGEIEVRAHRDGSWAAWRGLEATEDGPDGVTSSRFATAPVWMGRDARDLQVRVIKGPLTDLKIHVIRTQGRVASATRSAAEAGTPAPAIISRAGWGADESWRTCGPDYSDSVRYAIVHHTDSGNDYAPEDAAGIIRGIYRYHTASRGWCDIGYNFLVDRFGRVYEGRHGGTQRAVIGAHAGGFNSNSTGVALLGTYVSAPVPAAAQSALKSLLAWKLELHGVHPNSQIQVTSNGSTKYPEGTVVTLWTISGHRDVSATTCPGNSIYGWLPQLRNDVYKDMARYRWQAMGGLLDSGPDAVSTARDRLDLFAFAEGKGLSRKSWNGEVWSSWNPVGLNSVLGVTRTADPAATRWPGGRIDVFARGLDLGLWHVYWDGSKWSQPEALGGILESGPDVASSDGTIEVFARGNDGALWYKGWIGAGWTGWQSLGGQITSDPTAVSWGNGRVDVFARGQDNALWHRYRNSSGWSGWESWGGALASGPDSVSIGKNSVDVFAQGSDHSMCHKGWRNGTMIEWECFEGRFNSDPAAASWGPNRIDIFARATDGGLWHKWWDGSSWWG